jgi:hypothetical protein
MNLQPSDIFINVIVGAIGIGYFSFGKRRSEYYFMGCGLLLCIYPYFLDGMTSQILAGLFLTLLPFVMRLI